MSDKIVAEIRNEFGKGAARRLRRDHKIPAVLYGHGTDPVHLTLPGHQTMLAVKGANALLTLDVEGKEHLALAKDVQRDPIKPVIEHLDLVIVRRGEKVTVDVPVVVVGEAAAETVVNLENTSLQVEAEATHIPESIEVNVDGMTAGTQVHASAVTLPKGTTLVADPELLIVNVTGMISQEALDAELAGDTAEAAGAEAADEAGDAAEAGDEPAAEGEKSDASTEA